MYLKQFKSYGFVFGLICLNALLFLGKFAHLAAHPNRLIGICLLSICAATLSWQYHERKGAMAIAIGLGLCLAFSFAEMSGAAQIALMK
jgi:hypothetical protein